MFSAQNLLSIYTKSYTHTSLSFSFQHLIANGYFLWIIYINKRQIFVRTKQSNRTVFNRGSNSRSINCCRITEIRAQSWSVISQMRLIESVVIIKIPTALSKRQTVQTEGWISGVGKGNRTL